MTPGTWGDDLIKTSTEIYRVVGRKTNKSSLDFTFRSSVNFEKPVLVL